MTENAENATEGWKQSIGSTKAALILGNERSGLADIGANHSGTDRLCTSSRMLEFLA